MMFRKKQLFVSYQYEDGSGGFGFGYITCTGKKPKSGEDLKKLRESIARNNGFKSIVILFYRVI